MVMFSFIQGSRAIFCTTDQPPSFYVLDFADAREPAFRSAIQDGDATLGPFAQRAYFPCAETKCGGIWNGIHTSLPFFAIETRIESFGYEDVFQDGSSLFARSEVR